MLVHLVATQTPCSLEIHPKPIKIDFVNSKNYTKLLGYIKDLSIDQSRLEETFRGCLMSNVDADFDETKGSWSSKAISGDSLGGFIAAKHSFIPYIVDVASAEAYPLRDDLLLAQQIGYCQVEIQRDCMEDVNIMLDGGFSTTATMAIYDECAQYWKEFVAISISHYSRICNSVTHELARQAY